MSTTGLDVIESTFDTCGVNRDGQLEQDEIHEIHENCLETLETWFGLTEGWLHEISPKIDANADLKYP